MSTPIIDAFGEIDYLFEGQSALMRSLTAGTNHLVGAMDFLLYLTFAEVTPSIFMFEEGAEASDAAGTAAGLLARPFTGLRAEECRRRATPEAGVPVPCGVSTGLRFTEEVVSGRCRSRVAQLFPLMGSLPASQAGSRLCDLL